MNCDRCSKPTNVTKVSWFNIDTLCTDCQRQEEAHPDFTYAKDVEHAAVVKGNTNFPGVGWPGVEGRVPR
jgi:hypothetical protein